MLNRFPLLLSALLLYGCSAEPAKKHRQVPIAEGEPCPALMELASGSSSDGTSWVYSDDGKIIYTFKTGQYFDCKNGKWVRAHEREAEEERVEQIRLDRVARFKTGAPLTAEELQQTSFYDLIQDYVPYRQEEKEAEFQRYLAQQLIAQIVALRDAVKDNNSEAAIIAAKALQQLEKFRYESAKEND